MKIVSKYFTRYIGLIVFGISTVSFLVLLSITNQLAAIGHAQCVTVHSACSIIGHYPFESWLGFAGIGFIGLIGLYLTLKEETSLKQKVKVSKDIKEAIKTLNNEDKSIFETMKASDGFIHQSDLVQKTGFSKVKVSRILDRLETKGLVERRRRGMSNVVVLKSV